jgi:hypothetical protein
MPSLNLRAISPNSILSQDLSTSQRIQQNKSLSFLQRVWGSGLLFLALLFFPVLAFSADVTLAWDPNTEPDLEGYGVYFKKDAPGPPYDLFGNVALPELSDPDNPTFTLSGLQMGSKYYITVTAYDTAGNESAYADPVCAQIGDQIVPCASADTGSGPGSPSSGTGSAGSSGGGSGGGAGCFIETSLDHSQSYATIAALFSGGAVFFMGPGWFFAKKPSLNKKTR